MVGGLVDRGAAERSGSALRRHPRPTPLLRLMSLVPLAGEALALGDLLWGHRLGERSNRLVRMVPVRVGAS